MAVVRRRNESDASQLGDGARDSATDEALLLEETEGLLTALPQESTRADWDMPALLAALRSGDVKLPLSADEEQRFRKAKSSA